MWRLLALLPVLLLAACGQSAGERAVRGDFTKRGIAVEHVSCSTARGSTRCIFRERIGKDVLNCAASLRAGRLVQWTCAEPSARARPSAGSPAINLPPGVVTVARLTFPDGRPFSLALQRIGFEGRRYVCLEVANKIRLGPGKGGVQTEGTQQCEGPVPLRKRPLVAVMGSPIACKPRVAQLVWGLALRDVTVTLRSGTAERSTVRKRIPSALGAPGTLFYAWSYAAPASLIARASGGALAETYVIDSSGALATSCRTARSPFVLQSHGQPVHVYRPSR